MFFFSPNEQRAGGAGGALPYFFFFFFPCSADHERDWPPCKVVFFGLATNALNVRNNNSPFPCRAALGYPSALTILDPFRPRPEKILTPSFLLGRFSRRADIFAVTAAEFTAEGTANILVNRFIPLWGCPSTLLSDNGLQFCAQLAIAVFKLLGVHKLTTSAYHPSGNGGVERINHTMAQMLTMVCNEHQNDWDAHLPHVEYA